MRVEYTVCIRGNDYDFLWGWAAEHYHIEDVSFDTYEDAVAFCDGITKVQALEWERESRCNGLDIIIFEDQINDDGVHEYGFEIVGEYEWIRQFRNDPPMLWRRIR